MLPDEECDASEFGQLVRERREARGWSQDSLAAEALSNSERKGYVSLIENGKVPNVTQSTVKKFAQALDIDPKDIPAALRWPEAIELVQDTNTIDNSGLLLQHLEPKPEDVDAERKKLLVNFVGRVWLQDLFESRLRSRCTKGGYWITGDPGAGKSAASAFLFEACTAAFKAQFFFGHSKFAGNPIRSAVTSIIWQLRDIFVQDKGRLDEVISYLGYSEIALLDAFFKFVQRHNLNKNERIIVFWDGIDDLDEGSKHDFLTGIRGIRQNYEDFVVFVFSSQGDVACTREFDRLETFNITTHTKNAEDIAEYISKFSLQSITSKNISLLLKKSEESFIYVRHFIDEHDPSFDIDFENLPRGISDYYTDVQNKIFMGKSKNIKKKLNKILSMILTARTPVYFEDSAVIFGLDDHNDAYEVFTMLRPFLRRPYGQASIETFELYHQSLAKHLSDPMTGALLQSGQFHWLDLLVTYFDSSTGQLRPVPKNFHGTKATIPRILRQAAYVYLARWDFDELIALLSNPVFFLTCYVGNLRRAFLMWAEYMDEQISAAAAEAGHSMFGATSGIDSRVALLPDLLSENVDHWTSGRHSYKRELNTAIGQFYLQLELYDSAQERFRRALDSATAENAPCNILGQLHNLIGDAISQKSPTENTDAIKFHYEESYRHRLSARPGDIKPTEIIESLNNIGHYYFLKGDYQGAFDRHYFPALEQARQLPAGPFYCAADSAGMCGQCQDILGNTDQANQFFEEAVTVLDDLKDPDTWDKSWMIIATRGNSANFFQRIGDAEREIEQRKKAYELASAYYGSIHVKTLRTAMAFYRADTSQEELSSILDRIVETAKVVQADSVSVASFVLIAQDLMKYGQIARGRILLLSSLSRAVEMSNDEDIALVNHEIGYSYFAEGELEMAYEYFSKAYELRKNVLPASHDFTLRSLGWLIVIGNRLNRETQSQTLLGVYLKTGANTAQEDVVQRLSNLNNLVGSFNAKKPNVLLSAAPEFERLLEKLAYEKGYREDGEIDHAVSAALCFATCHPATFNSHIRKHVNAVVAAIDNRLVADQARGENQANFLYFWKDLLLSLPSKPTSLEDFASGETISKLIEHHLWHPLYSTAMNLRNMTPTHAIAIFRFIVRNRVSVKEILGDRGDLIVGISINEIAFHFFMKTGRYIYAARYYRVARKCFCQLGDKVEIANNIINEQRAQKEAGLSVDVSIVKAAVTCLEELCDARSKKGTSLLDEVEAFVEGQA